MLCYYSQLNFTFTEYFQTRPLFYLIVRGRDQTDPVEQRVAEARYDARLAGGPHHRVRLARPGLPVRQDTRIVTLDMGHVHFSTQFTRVTLVYSG